MEKKSSYYNIISFLLILLGILIATGTCSADAQPPAIDPLRANTTGRSLLYSDDEIITVETGYLTPLVIQEVDGEVLNQTAFNFQVGDELATGDLNGDGTEEIIWGSSESGNITVTDRHVGGVLISFDDNFRGYDGLAVGDINGDGKDNIIHAVQVAALPGGARIGYIKVFEVNAFADGASSGDYECIKWIWLQYIGQDFWAGDGLAAGDVDGDGIDEIVHGSARDEKIHIYGIQGQIGWPFDVAFESFDGLSVGDLNGDYVDEIVHADCHDWIWVLDKDGYIFVAGQGESGEDVLFSFEWEFEGNDRIAVGDVDGDHRDEIVHADHSQNKLRFLEIVYDGNDTYNGIGTLKDDLAIAFDAGDRLALGDVNGDSIWVGDPGTPIVETVTDQVLAIINAPPKHAGVNYEPGRFWAAYENTDYRFESQIVYAKSSHTTTRKLSVSADWWGLAKISSGYEKKFGRKYETEHGQDNWDMFSYLIEADMEDAKVTVNSRFWLYEYPILSPLRYADIDNEPQYILVRVPMEDPVVGLGIPESEHHELGDITSYPQDRFDLPNYPGDENFIKRFQINDLGADPRQYKHCWGDADIDVEKKSSFIQNSWRLGGSTGFDMFGIGVTLSASIQGSYGNQKMTTHEIRATDNMCLSVVYVGGIHDQDKKYSVESVWFYDALFGHLVLDHSVIQMGSYYEQNNYIPIKVKPIVPPLKPAGPGDIIPKSF